MENLYDKIVLITYYYIFMTDFYTSQIEQLNSAEVIQNYIPEISQYAKSMDSEQSKILKDFIVKKAVWELSFQESRVLRDYIGKEARNATGKEKMKLYELASAIMSHITPSQMEKPQKQWNEVLALESFQVIKGEITQKTLTIGRGIDNKDKTYTITGSEVEALWENTFKITLDASAKAWKYGRYNTQAEILVRYTWGSVLEVLDPNTKESLGMVRVEKTFQTESVRPLPGGGYEKIIQNGKNTARFEMNYEGKHIKLELQLP